MSVLAADTALVVAGLAFVMGVVVLVLLVWAPWKSVRAEPPLPDDVETRLLLGESPERIVEEEVQEEEEAREKREGGEVFDLDPERHTSR